MSLVFHTAGSTVGVVRRRGLGAPLQAAAASAMGDYGNSSLFMRSADNMGFGLKSRNRRNKPPAMPLTDEEKKEIEEAFTLFDADKTGTVDYHELKVWRSCRLFQPI